MQCPHVSLWNLFRSDTGMEHRIELRPFRLDLFHNFHMDVRASIFYILFSSETFEEAFECSLIIEAASS